MENHTSFSAREKEIMFIEIKEVRFCLAYIRQHEHFWMFQSKPHKTRHGAIFSKEQTNKQTNKQTNIQTSSINGCYKGCFQLSSSHHALSFYFEAPLWAQGVAAKPPKKLSWLPLSTLSWAWKSGCRFTRKASKEPPTNILLAGFCLSTALLRVQKTILDPTFLNQKNETLIFRGQLNKPVVPMDDPLNCHRPLLFSARRSDASRLLHLLGLELGVSVWWEVFFVFLHLCTWV